MADRLRQNARATADCQDQSLTEMISIATCMMISKLLVPK